MIRDPSDGSVREKPEEPRAENPTGAHGAQTTGKTPAIASGLPVGSTKPENLARLEKSREWLRLYRLNQGTTEPASTPERSSERREV